MTIVDHAIGIWAFSGGFWLIFAFYTSFRIRSFIIKRYEEETNLLNSVFFKEHATFTRYLPNLFASVTYIVHLLICLWAWRIYEGRKVFRDIKDPSVVTQHFSPKEIRRVKWFAINGIILISYGVALIILRSVWPDAFN